jgi:HlyD family secretion protein
MAAVFAGLLASVVAVWHWLSPGVPTAHYKIAVVDRGPITAAVTATGTVNPVVSVQVGSQISGKIKALSADFNSVVTKGQMIAQVDPAPYEARVRQATAARRNAEGALAKAQATLAQRKLERDRAERLRAQGFIPQSELDLARTAHREATAQVEVAQAQVDQTQAALANAELDLGYTTIYSPVDGVVVSRNVDAGQTVAAALQAPTLFVIAQDLTQMQVNANVSESDIGGVTEGKTAEFHVDAYPRETFKGTVAQVRHQPLTVQNVVTYHVVITVANPELKLKPGMTANVSIITAQESRALRVPNQALRFKMPEANADVPSPAVWLLDPAGTARPLSVTPGVSDGTFTQIREGSMKEGDAVIIGLEEGKPADQPALPPGFTGPKIR